MVGGLIVLTSRRLLFRPWDTRKTTDLGKFITELVFTGEYAVLGKVISKAYDLGQEGIDSKAGAVTLHQVTSVRAGRGPGLLHPPCLVLNFGDGHEVKLGVVRGTWSPNFLPANATARDEMVKAIQERLAK